MNAGDPITGGLLACLLAAGAIASWLLWQLLCTLAAKALRAVANAIVEAFR